MINYISPAHTYAHVTSYVSLSEPTFVMLYSNNFSRNAWIMQKKKVIYIHWVKVYGYIVTYVFCLHSVLFTNHYGSIGFWNNDNNDSYTQNSPKTVLTIFFPKIIFYGLYWLYCLSQHLQYVLQLFENANFVHITQLFCHFPPDTFPPNF